MMRGKELSLTYIHSFLLFQVHFPAHLRHIQPGLLALLPLRKEQESAAGRLNRAKKRLKS